MTRLQIRLAIPRSRTTRGPHWGRATRRIATLVPPAGSQVSDTPQTPRVTATEPAWKLEEAKSRFGEVVRLAAEGQPQRVTVRGRSAVVVVAADECDRLRARDAAPNLHGLLSRSPLAGLDFGGEPVRVPVREVDVWPAPDHRLPHPPGGTDPPSP